MRKLALILATTALTSCGNPTPSADLEPITVEQARRDYIEAATEAARASFPIDAFEQRYEVIVETTEKIGNGYEFLRALQYATEYLEPIQILGLPKPDTLEIGFGSGLRTPLEHSSEHRWAAINDHYHLSAQQVIRNHPERVEAASQEFMEIHDQLTYEWWAAHMNGEGTPAAIMIDHLQYIISYTALPGQRYYPGFAKLEAVMTDHKLIPPRVLELYDIKKQMRNGAQEMPKIPDWAKGTLLEDSIELTYALGNKRFDELPLEVLRNNRATHLHLLDRSQNHDGDAEVEQMVCKGINYVELTAGERKDCVNAFRASGQQLATRFRMAHHMKVDSTEINERNEQAEQARQQLVRTIREHSQITSLSQEVKEENGVQLIYSPDSKHIVYSTRYPAVCQLGMVVYNTNRARIDRVDLPARMMVRNTTRADLEGSFSLPEDSLLSTYQVDESDNTVESLRPRGTLVIGEYTSGAYGHALATFLIHENEDAAALLSHTQLVGSEDSCDVAYSQRTNLTNLGNILSAAFGAPASTQGMCIFPQRGIELIETLAHAQLVPRSLPTYLSARTQMRQRPSIAEKMFDEFREEHPENTYTADLYVEMLELTDQVTPDNLLNTYRYLGTLNTLGRVTSKLHHEDENGDWTATAYALQELESTVFSAQQGQFGKIPWYEDIPELVRTTPLQLRK